MDGKHMKKCSSFITRDMQIKTTVRHSDTLTEIVKTTQMLVRMWSDKPSFIAGGNAKWYSHFGRQFGNFLQG
jgi:hypothetical protein